MILIPFQKMKKFIISIGNNRIRKKISEKFHFSYQTIVHQSAIVSKLETIIAKGTVVMANSVINPNVKIGKHCIINTASVIEHDCILNNFVHISPNATLSGNVQIGEGTHIGSGAVIIPGVNCWKVVHYRCGSCSN